MKKIFNLAVAMSVIASSLFFASCGEDEDEEDEPKKEQGNNTPTNNNDNQNNNNQNTAKAETSVTVKAGETYVISNSKLGVNTTMSIDAVSGTTVTVSVGGSTVTVGSGSADPSYAIVATDGGLEAVSMGTAKNNAANVLFICKSGSVLASGTLATSTDINTKASETTFTKQ